MKKKINKKKIPAYEFGIDKIQALASLSQLLGTSVQSASDETSKANVAGSALSGLGAGAAAGAMFGPIGAGIGAAIGGIGGTVKGIIDKNAIEEQERRNNTSKLTQYGMNTAANAAQEYYSKNGVAYTFENGGILPDLAYVDNDEILRSVTGDLVKVPNTTNGTDQHLIDASNLESVLSDKIKKPGTKRTFAQEGKKLLDMTKPSKGKDKFAENTNRLNKINANKAYEALLAEQESVKMSKGVKPKVKGIPAYENGLSNDSRRLGREIPLISGEAFQLYGQWFGNLLKDALLTPAEGIAKNEALNAVYRSANIGKGGLGNIRYSHDTGVTSLSPGSITPYGEYYSTSNSSTPYVLQIPKNVTTVTEDPASTTIPDPVTVNGNFNKPKRIATKTVNKKTNLPEAPTLYAPLSDVWQSPLKVMPAAKPKTMPKVDTTAAANTSDKSTTPTDNNFNADLLSLTPVLYNFIQSIRKPEIESTVTNPYSGTIRSTLAKRRANINDVLESNRRNRAISNYNLSQLNTNTGSSLAARTQAAVANATADAAAYTQASNINNQYLGDYANMLNNLGQQFVQSQTLTNDLNARNRASARNFGASTASQIGKWSQVNTQMNNQYNRDMMMLPFLADFLSQGYTEDEVKALYNRTRNRN